MLRVQRNLHRDFINLDGLWGLSIDPDQQGEDKGWHNGFSPAHTVAVPGSWNEQLQESGLMNYTGDAWLQSQCTVPGSFVGRDWILRIGSAEFFATVWVNSKKVGDNANLFLPFDCVIPASVCDINKPLTIVVKVSNLLKADSITQAVTQHDYLAENRYRDEIFPAVRFDFFPFGGIHRPVYLSALPHQRVQRVEVNTRLHTTSENKATKATVSCNVEHSAGEGASLSLALNGESLAAQSLTPESQSSLTQRHTLTFDIDNQTTPFWSPNNPYLHELSVILHDEQGTELDSYQLNIGFREVKIEASQLLINEEPVFLRGFGKHEDSPIHGKGLNLPQMVKDFGLMKWIAANSFRTSHYPYAEEWLDFADREGVLVISEIPSVNLDFRRVNDTTLANHKTAINAQFARDFNHPCVIAWSLANEAGFLNEPEYQTQSGHYWQQLFSHARQKDASRPMTMANVLYVGSDDPVFEYCDFISINRYYGWYQEPGQLHRALENLAEELNYIWRTYNKPILVSEFGADTLCGQHSTSDQLFTEEYQADLLTGYCKVIEASPYCIGEHIWNFADFRTAQHFRRAVLNLKGVFTRNRDPKRSAFALRDLWSVDYQPIQRK